MGNVLNVIIFIIEFEVAISVEFVPRYLGVSVVGCEGQLNMWMMVSMESKGPPRIFGFLQVGTLELSIEMSRSIKTSLVLN